MASRSDASSDQPVRCRRIQAEDLEALAILLAEGFPAKPLTAWRHALARLKRWGDEAGQPNLGFVLAKGQALVGCLLTLDAANGQRCNFSSWYVQPAYQRLGAMLVNMAARDKGQTYINVSSERSTRAIIEAQGFKPYTAGVMLSVPLLSLVWHESVRIAWARPDGIAVSATDAALMAHHAAFGCITFWCVANGQAFPFVIVRRRVKGAVTAAQLVYCAPDTDWRRLSRAVGTALAQRGLFLLLVDAQSTVPGLPGRFMPGRMLKYARGPKTPRCGDLAYSEVALLGT